MTVASWPKGAWQESLPCPPLIKFSFCTTTWRTDWGDDMPGKRACQFYFVFKLNSMKTSLIYATWAKRANAPTALQAQPGRQKHHIVQGKHKKKEKEQRSGGTFQDIFLAKAGKPQLEDRLPEGSKGSSQPQADTALQPWFWMGKGSRNVAPHWSLSARRRKAVPRTAATKTPQNHLCTTVCAELPLQVLAFHPSHY